MEKEKIEDIDIMKALQTVAYLEYCKYATVCNAFIMSISSIFSFSIDYTTF